MNLRQELAANMRLRLGLALVAGILGGYSVLVWGDHQQSLAERYRQLSGQLRRLSTPQSLKQWPQRAKDAQNLLPQYEARLWRQPTFALAQATLQDWLRQQLLLVNAKKSDVKIAEADPASALLGTGAADVDAAASAPADTAPGLARVGAEITFSSDDPETMLALLSALASSEHKVFVDSLNVKQRQINLKVSAWFRLRPAAAASAISAPS